ncbi:MAG TPA: sodium/solute symporter [Tepidisphaeraceae bacterium]|nr:sodium/solute symporter [Tepidisphaeraceae bacterium]
MASHFGWIDLAIIIAYLLVLAGIGVYFSRRQTGLEDYFRAGQSMGWVPVGLSLMAALNSGIDYMTQPSASIQYGLVYLPSLLTWPLAYAYVVYLILPFYRRLNVYSVYEYLERRFDVRVRSLAAVIFILWRLGWMATALYVPCLAVSAASDGWLPLVPTILVLGTIVTVYTALGGIKGVIWTDVVQFCVMFSGLAVTVAVIVWNVPGGFPQIWQVADAGGKTALNVLPQAPANADPREQLWAFFTTPVTGIGIFIAILVSRLAAFTSDQMTVQRFQTARSVADQRPAFVINAAGDVLWMAGLSFVGLALYAYYQHYGEVEGITHDQTLPYFMARVFPVGVTGLVIAAIFAASLSSVDSALNSSTTVVLVDFYNRLYLRRQMDDRATAQPSQPLTRQEQQAQIAVSRIVTLVLGGIGTALACNVGQIGDLVRLGTAVVASFTGPLLGIYLLGIFTRRAQSTGVLIGGVAGSFVTISVAFFSPISGMWPSSFGLVITLLLGYALSCLLPVPATRSKGESLCFRAVMAPAQR